MKVRVGVKRGAIAALVAGTAFAGTLMLVNIAPAGATTTDRKSVV